MDWKTHWEEETGDERFCRVTASDHVSRLMREVHLSSHHQIVDFGCGQAYALDQLSPHLGSLFGYEPSTAMRVLANRAVSHRSNVSIVDNRDDIPVGWADYVISNSVTQYLTATELKDAIDWWWTLLKPGGTALISDVLGKEQRFFRELALATLLSLRSRRPFAFIKHCAGHVSKSYLTSASTTPLSVFPAQAFLDMGSEAGFHCTILARNLTYNSDRYTISLSKPK